VSKAPRLQQFVSYLRFHFNDLVRIALILVAVLLATWLLPKKLYFQYEYELNKPWVYRDLIAPFDFPVYKSQDQLTEDARKALSDHAPYFRLDTLAEENALQALPYILVGRSDSAELINRLKSTIKLIYREGLAEPVDIELGAFVYRIDAKKRIDKVDPSSFFNLNGAVNLLREQWGETNDANRLVSFAEEQLRYNLRYDENFTNQMREELLAGVSETLGMVQEGELIIGKGALVGTEAFRKVRSLEKEYGTGQVTSQQVWLATAGQFLIVALITLILIFYLYYFRPELYSDNRRLLVLLLNLVGIVALFSFSVNQGISSIYLIPFCILPIITRALFDAWVAMMTLVVAALLCSFFSGYASEFLVLQLTAGMSSVFSLISIRRRSQFFITTSLIFVVYSAGYTAYTLISKGDYTDLIPLYYGYFGVNALLTLIASPLLFGYEKLFGFVSDVTLMELSDTNAPLLRELSFKAPGTFQHSLQVSNLAEAAIYEVGGNALLVRVGALYHDIGKMNNPMYFIENQAGLNPHDDLPFEDSAQIIVGHVLDGIALAKAQKLPNVIIDFIRTHHGDQRVEYFYQSFLKNYPHQTIDEAKFRYPGPKPFNKETAVLMMADSVEAASRSLPEHTEQSINDLVDAIIDKQIKNDQFINANITLRDISKIKTLFKKMLGSIYHVRIAYPGT
jgi:hypothetical protein